MPEPDVTPRRFPRLNVLGNIIGEVSLLHDVAVLDLSEAGACLEHAGRFTLGATCFLRLPAPEGELVLKARVVHSAASRTVPGMAGEPTLLFQSGVEFVGLTSESLLALRQLVARLREGPPPA